MKGPPVLLLRRNMCGENIWFDLEKEFIIYFVDTKQVAQISQTWGEETISFFFSFWSWKKSHKIDLFSMKRDFLTRHEFDFIISKLYCRWCDAGWRVAFLKIYAPGPFLKMDSKILGSGQDLNPEGVTGFSFLNLCDCENV